MTRAIASWWMMVVAMIGLCWLGNGCRTGRPNQDVLVVEKSAVERCGDRWCVTDGWMMEVTQDLASCNDALADCLRELGGDE